VPQKVANNFSGSKVSKQGAWLQKNMENTNHSKKTRLNIEHISETYPKFLKFPLHEKNRSINHRWGSIRIFLDAYFVRPRLGLRMDRTKNWHNIPQVHPSLTRQKDRSAWEHAMLWTFKAGQHVYPVAEQPMLQHIKTNPPFQKIKSHNQCFQNINFKWPGPQEFSTDLEVLSWRAV
jgi:hypothetical protein